MKIVHEGAQVALREEPGPIGPQFCPRGRPVPPECTTAGCPGAAVAEASANERWMQFKPYCDPCQQRLFQLGYTVRKYVSAVHSA